MAEDNNNDEKYRLPHSKTLEHASKIAIRDDKPIMLDYWAESLDRNILIGVRESGEKLLVKNEDEYTSPIAKIYKVENTDYIILTENSIYLVDSNIESKQIS
tara:strand:+ start:87 stop:392 length:306 start_codon:yes stop_codon:yes gene_type:complete